MAEAAAADRFTTELADWRALIEHREAWKALAGRAIEPNVFHDPDFALPVIGALGLIENIRAVLVWREGEAGGRALAGVFLFVERHRWGIPIRVGEALIHPYAMSSAPLVDARAAGETLAAFLFWLEHSRAAPAAWLFRFLPADGPLHAALADRAQQAGVLIRGYGSQGRAVLDSADLDDSYLTAAIGGRHRKEYRRLRRRLESHGAVIRSRAQETDAVRAAMAEFQGLEASGWKGRAGTAAALSPATARMFEEIAAGLGAAGQMRIDALRIDDAPIAMAVSCGEGERWWLWKIAYDEHYARYSPGALLVRALTEEAIAAHRSEYYDSCALPGHPMIERIWRQRRPYTDLLIVPARPGSARQVAICRLETLRRHIEGSARRVRNLVQKR